MVQTHRQSGGGQPVSHRATVLVFIAIVIVAIVALSVCQILARSESSVVVEVDAIMHDADGFSDEENPSADIPAFPELPADIRVVRASADRGIYELESDSSGREAAALMKGQLGTAGWTVVALDENGSATVDAGGAVQVGETALGGQAEQSSSAERAYGYFSAFPPDASSGSEWESGASGTGEVAVLFVQWEDCGTGSVMLIQAGRGKL